MDPTKLIHDPSRVLGALQELPDSRLVTTKGCKIYIPVRFAERGLASIGLETYICGVYAMTVEDQYYGVSLINSMLRIDPSSTVKVDVNGDEYYEFTFDPGSVVVLSLDLVQTDTLVYKIFDEIISKGRVPWYLNYLELGGLFDSAVEHAGANIGRNQEVTELLISMISRNPDDRHQYYRRSVQSLDQIKSDPPAFIALRSVTYAATNTTNRLAGSHFAEGLVSALVTPSERVERMEDLLRR